MTLLEKLEQIERIVRSKRDDNHSLVDALEKQEHKITSLQGVTMMIDDLPQDKIKEFHAYIQCQILFQKSLTKNK